MTCSSSTLPGPGFEDRPRPLRLRPQGWTGMEWEGTRVRGYVECSLKPQRHSKPKIGGSFLEDRRGVRNAQPLLSPRLFITDSGFLCSEVSSSAAEEVRPGLRLS